MKKLFVLFLIFSLILSLAGCKGSTGPTNPDTIPTAPETQPETVPSVPGTEPETTPETTPIDYTSLAVEDCVKTGYEQVGSYTDDVGNENAYSFYLPEITLDCPGAEEINESIRTDFQADGEQALKEAEEGASLWFYRMDYTASLQNGILSILINQETVTEYINYAVYNLDLSTGEAANRATVLAAFGMAEEEFVSKVQAQAESVYLERYGDGSQFPENMAADYDTQLEKTRTQNDDAPAFIDVEGRLSAVVNVYSLAGAEYYPETVEIP